jgi:uncharacterized protein
MIRLHSLKIERFRGVREGKIEGFADVNLLIGRNNCGKTTVVEAIMKTLWLHVQGVDVLGRHCLSFWSQIRQESGSFLSEWWFRQDKSRPIALTVELQNVGQNRVVESSPLWIKIVDQPRQDFQHSEVAQLQILVESKEELVQFIKGMILFRPLDGLNQEIERKLWPQLLANRRDKILTKSLNEIFGLEAESFQLLPDNRLIVLFDSYSLPLDAQGDGTRAAIRSLMVLAMTRRSLFIMEEPECHQHPGSMARYAKTLCGLAKEQEVQLLISTHSAECARAFLDAAKEKKSEAEVFHLSLTDGKQEARRLDAEAVETLQSTGVDVRFLDLYA